MQPKNTIITTNPHSRWIEVRGNRQKGKVPISVRTPEYVRLNQSSSGVETEDRAAWKNLVPLQSNLSYQIGVNP